MIKTSWFRGLLTLCIAGGFVASLGGEAEAQAWVSEKGEASASVNYTTGISETLVDPDGKSYDVGDLSIDNHTMNLGAAYVPMDRLGLTMALPLVMVRYSGEQDGGFPPHGDYDDGDYHFAPTDFRFAARYQLIEGSKTIAPHIGFSVPTSDYETHGYAGLGRHIYQAHMGLSAGAVLDPWLPRAYVHLTGEYSLGTKPEVTDEMFASDTFDEYGQDYIDLEFTTGYFVTDELTLSGVVSYHQQLDGVTYDDVFNNPGDMVLVDWHDIALKETYMHAGLDVAYQVTPELSATAYIRTYLSGTNTRDLIGGGIGISYTFLKATPPPIDDEWDEWDEGDDWSEEDLEGVEAVVEGEDEADAATE